MPTAIVSTALCVIDREQGGAEAFAEIDLAMVSLFTRSELETADSADTQL